MRILEVRTEQPNNIKTLFEAFKEIFNEVNLIFTPSIKTKDGEIKQGGMKVLVVNEEKTIVMDLRLYAENFKGGFMCKRNKIVCGISVQTFYKFIKTVGVDDTLTLYIDDENENKLKIRIDKGENYNSYTNFEINLLDIDYEERGMNSIEFDIKIRMLTNEFQKKCKDSKETGAEKLKITCIDDQIIFSATGDEGSMEAVYQHSKNEGNFCGVNIKRTSKSKTVIIEDSYSLKNLTFLAKCSSLCSKVHLLLKNSRPLCIKYDVGTLGRVIFFIHPHTDDSDYEDEDDSDSDIDEISDIKLELLNNA